MTSSDISAVSTLVNLRELYLDTNYISDISVLVNLVDIRRLSLRNNYVSDISALTVFINLTWLDIQDNFLDRDSYCVYLPVIEENNPTAEIYHDTNPYNCDVDSL